MDIMHIIIFIGKMPESPNSSNDHVECDGIQEEGSDEEYAKSKYYYTRTADRLSDEEKEEIIRLASIRPDNPAFVTVLQMSHVRRKSNFLVSLLWCMYIHCGP
jgi:hypothetical protein